MSTRTKSVFSGMGGLIGALAGIVTVAVGVLTIGSQLGWFDSDTDSGTSKSGQDPSAADSGTNSGGSQGGATRSPAAAKAEFQATPSKVDFGLLPSGPQEVKLENVGTTAFSFEDPQVGGNDPEAFDVEDVDCSGRTLQKGAECRIRIEFSPSRSGTFSGKVEVPVSGSDRAAEITVTGNKPL